MKKQTAIQTNLMKKKPMRNEIKCQTKLSKGYRDLSKIRLQPLYEIPSSKFGGIIAEPCGT